MRRIPAMRVACRQSAVTAWWSRALPLTVLASLVTRPAGSPSSFSQPVGGSTSAWSPSTPAGIVANAAASSAAGYWA